MIEYSSEDISNIDADGIFFPINCVGVTASAAAKKFQKSFPENARACKTAFDEGVVEPGKLVMVPLERGQRKLKIYNLATKIHWKGQLVEPAMRSGIEAIVEDVIQQGLKSIAISEFGGQSQAQWQQIQLMFLVSFARIPGIKIIFCPAEPRSTPLKHVTMFTDGGAEPNPGVGGYGVVLRFGDTMKELFAGYAETTNNRMELLAAIVGLETLKETCQVRVFSDSRYVVDAVNTGAVFRWYHGGWRPGKVKNPDLWKRFLNAFLGQHVEMVWVKGHAGIADNERCDALASRAIKAQSHQVDQGYLDSKARKAVAQGQIFPASSTDANRPAVAQGSNKKNKRGPKPKKVGDPCRNCSTALVRRETKKSKPNSAFYYPWYLYCNNCSKMFHVEAAKVTRAITKS